MEIVLGFFVLLVVAVAVTGVMDTAGDPASTAAPPARRVATSAQRPDLGVA